MKQLLRCLSASTIVALINSCATPLPTEPVDVYTYISTPLEGTFRGFDRHGNARILLFTETDKFICFDPKDAEVLLK